MDIPCMYRSFVQSKAKPCRCWLEHACMPQQAATVLGGALADALPYGLAFVVLACQLAAMEVLKLLSFHYAVWRRLL